MYDDIIPESIRRIFSMNLRRIISCLNLDYDKLQEIRLRSNQPLIVLYDNHEYFVEEGRGLTFNQEKAYIVKISEMKETMEYVSNYSLYAFEEELRQGYITVMGGHRVGLSGKVIMESSRIKTIKYISCMNIRFAHEIIGCSDGIMRYLYRNGSIYEGVYNTLIISPPACGKTTLLRDIIRNLSSGEEGINVGVVDERSEIAACYLGVPQNDVGIRTDVLDACPKALGITMLIRTMSPKVIAVDEIGSERDMEAIRTGINCGCAFLGTAHGKTIGDMLKKPFYKKMIAEGIFERFILLDRTPEICTVTAILDEKLRDVYG